MHLLSRSVRALSIPLLGVGALAACEPVDGPARGPQPVTSFTFDDDEDPGIVNLEGELTMRACGIAVRDEHVDRYFADGQASTSPSPTTLIVYFIETNLEPPPPGDLAVPDAAAVRLMLPSPYGTLNASGGTVRVSERDGWRMIDLEDVPVSSAGDSGVLNATLACGL